MTIPYDAAFYQGQADGSANSAAVIIPLLISRGNFTTAIDVGCGVGPWAAELQRNGVQTIGIDGDYVDRTQLKIPLDKFVVKDLRQPISMDRQFDLAVSLEVAEHLPQHRGPGFVADLVALAPCVLFSAALPGQGGTDHINEQPLSYWADQFAKNGYEPADLIRPIIWNDSRVEFWYRQNIVIFAKRGHSILPENPPPTLDYIHPRLLETVIYERNRIATRPLGMKEIVRALPGVIGRSIRRRC